MSDNAPTPELVALLALVDEIDATETVPATAHPDCNALIKMIDIDDWHTLRDWFRSTRAATVPQGVSVDAARLNYVLGKVFFDRHGPCLPCGRTKIDQDMIAESIKHIDAATTPPPAELGRGS